MELLPQFALYDRLIYSVALALQQELSNPGFSGQLLYLDSLLTTLYTHLLRHYSTKEPIQVLPGNLSLTTLNRVEEYIEAHLAEDLSLKQLATIAQISPNYFLTKFKESRGITPHQYIIQQRISQAKKLILAGKPLVETADLVGFTDQSHLTRYFKRIVGVTPKQFLQNQ